MKALFFLATVYFLITACSHAPPPPNSDLSLLERSYQFEKKSRPINIDSETVVLDTRNFFEYQLSRLRGAVLVDPREYSLSHLRGDEQQTQAFKIARHLALIGINPFSHVVVVGYGDKGHGEEGEVALTLLMLGVERVQIGNLDDLKRLMRTKMDPVRANERYWEPRLVSAINCPPQFSNSMGFIINIGKKHFSPQIMSTPLPVLPRDWKEFLNLKDFSPNYEAKTALTNDKVGEDSRLMVRGPQAPIVVFSLLQMGYGQACLLDE